MVIVHHLENSRSQRVLWLLEELSAPYDIKRYDRVPDTGMGPPDLYALHPLGKSPIIEIDGVMIAETGAIFEYLLELFDGDNVLHPRSGSDLHRNHIYWLHYAEGSAMMPLLMKLVFSAIPDRAPSVFKSVFGHLLRPVHKKFIDPRIAEHVAYWDQHLAATGWFGGEEMSAIDIMMSFPLEAASQRIDLSDYSNVRSFLTRIHQRPGYQTALDRGGPYIYA